MHRMRMNLARVGGTVAVFAWTALVAWCNVAGDQRLPDTTKFYLDALGRADAVIIGRYVDGQPVQIKDEEGPIPKATSEVVKAPEDLVPTTVWRIPAMSAFLREGLMDPPKIWAYRAQLEVLDSFHGDLRKKGRLTVNLCYGRSPAYIEHLLNVRLGAEQLPVTKGSILMLLLRKVEGAEGGPSEPAGEASGAEGRDVPGLYDLTWQPQVVKEGDIEQKSQLMRRNMARFAVLTKIDMLVRDLKEGEVSKVDELVGLLTSPIPDAGPPGLTETAKATLNDRVLGIRAGKAAPVDLQAWWKTWRSQFFLTPAPADGQ